ncbi:MAG TPA: anti-sigma factor [Candidatus Cybelea sp.]|nr:anti-sigma factor [Candidatus Cybelea sp.]
MSTTEGTGAEMGDERDQRAAEYVLGTLAGPERDAFEAELGRDAALRRAVAAWSLRLQPLADSVAPVAPPRPLRTRVMDGIPDKPEIAPEWHFNFRRWLAWTLGASALAGVVAALAVFLFMPRQPELGGYAMLHDTAGSNAVVVFQTDKNRQDMVIYASVPGAGSDRDYELWLLPPAGKKPISLGVFKPGEREERPLAQDAAQYIKSGVNFAVSVEPAGGSPSGAPTGPVVYGGIFHPPGE